MRYRFDKFHDAPGKDFFYFLAGRKKIPEYEAIKQYNEFAAAFRSRINREEAARWEGIGFFKKDASGEIVLEETDKPFLLFAPVEAKAISRPPVQEIPITQEQQPAEPETITSEISEDVVLAETEAPVLPEEPLAETAKERAWWIVALTLFILIVVVLLVYFYNKGLVWRSFFNQQTLF
ncbi:MAG: hypothetical protein INR73_04590 [Williamsia sp.]|nr:hypothetical protein [Williamsia sp.]